MGKLDRRLRTRSPNVSLWPRNSKPGSGRVESVGCGYCGSSCRPWNGATRLLSSSRLSVCGVRSLSWRSTGRVNQGRNRGCTWSISATLCAADELAWLRARFPRPRLRPTTPRSRGHRTRPPRPTPGAAGQVRVADGLPLASVLAEELAAFRVKVTLAGNEQFEAWREKDHDDLVLAVAPVPTRAASAASSGTSFLRHALSAHRT